MTFRRVRKEEHVRGISQRQEKRIAKEAGGSVQPGSGCFGGHRGDVKTRGYLIEAKTTESHSYRITLKTLGDLVEKALHSGREPVLWLTFSKAHHNNDWVCIPADIFNELRDEEERT